VEAGANVQLSQPPIPAALDEKRHFFSAGAGSLCH
jgi:hypothetical protein